MKEKANYFIRKKHTYILNFSFYDDFTLIIYTIFRLSNNITETEYVWNDYTRQPYKTYI